MASILDLLHKRCVEDIQAQEDADFLLHLERALLKLTTRPRAELVGLSEQANKEYGEVVSLALDIFEDDCGVE